MLKLFFYLLIAPCHLWASGDKPLEPDIVHPAIISPSGVNFTPQYPMPSPPQDRSRIPHPTAAFNFPPPAVSPPEPIRSYGHTPTVTGATNKEYYSPKMHPILRNSKLARTYANFTGVCCYISSNLFRTMAIFATASISAISGIAYGVTDPETKDTLQLTVVILAALSPALIQLSYESKKILQNREKEYNMFDVENPPPAAMQIEMSRPLSEGPPLMTPRGPIAIQQHAEIKP